MSSVIGTLGQGALTAGPMVASGYAQGRVRGEEAKSRRRKQDVEAQYRQGQVMAQLMRLVAEEGRATLDRKSREKLAGDEAAQKEQLHLESIFFNRDRLADAAATGQLPTMVARYHAITGRFPFGEEGAAPNEPVGLGPKPPVDAPPEGITGTFNSSDRAPEPGPKARIPEITPTPLTAARTRGAVAQAQATETQTQGQQLENFFLAATLSPRIKKAVADGDYAQARAIYEAERPRWEDARLEIEKTLADSIVDDREAARFLQKYGIDVNRYIALMNRRSIESEGEKNRKAAETRARITAGAGDAAYRQLRNEIMMERLETLRSRVNIPPEEMSAFNRAMAVATNSAKTTLGQPSVSDAERQKARDTALGLWEKWGKDPMELELLSPELFESERAKGGKPAPRGSSLPTVTEKSTGPLVSQEDVNAASRTLDQGEAKVRSVREEIRRQGSAADVARFDRAIAEVRRRRKAKRPAQKTPAGRR